MNDKIKVYPYMPILKNSMTEKAYSEFQKLLEIYENINKEVENE